MTVWRCRCCWVLPQVFLLLISFAAVPFMLFPKPFILKKRHEASERQVRRTSWLQLQYSIVYPFLQLPLRSVVRFYVQAVVPHFSVVCYTSGPHSMTSSPSLSTVVHACLSPLWHLRGVQRSLYNMVGSLSLLHA